MPPRRDSRSEGLAPTPSSDGPGGPGGFLDGLRDRDPQVRLNAAVRLAYLGRAEGLEELLEGLAHESFAIRFTQVPDALARLGGAGAGRLERLAAAPGPARLGAARALARRGRLGGVPEAVAALLGDPDHPTRWAAAVLAGELGPAAGVVAADALRRTLQAGGPELTLGPQALAAVAGTAALPVLRREPERPSAALREFYDGDCLGTYSLGASREGDEQVRLATVVWALEAAARAGPFDVVLVRLVGGPWTCEISPSDEPHPGGSRQQAAPDGGRSGLAVEGIGETIEAAIAGALAHATGSGAPPGGAPG